MTLEKIKKFVDNKMGFDISYKSHEYGYKFKEESKVFFRWFYIYLCYKYSDEYITNQKIGDVLGVTPATIIHGIGSFQDLIQYDKTQSKNFKIIEDSFIEEFDVKTKELMELISVDRLKLIKQNNNLKAKIRKLNALALAI